MSESVFSVSLIVIVLSLIVYLADSLYARRFVTISKKSLSFVSAALLIGVFGEVFVETIYNALIGQPLWYYQFLPTHNAYTSYFSVVLWAMYGMHLYWVSEATMSRYPTMEKWKLVSILAVESLALETLANVIWLAVFGYYIYYYTPADLWHATTVVNIPCYFAASWAIISTVKRFEKDRYFYFGVASLILLVFLWFP